MLSGLFPIQLLLVFRSTEVFPFQSSFLPRFMGLFEAVSMAEISGQSVLKLSYVEATPCRESFEDRGVDTMFSSLLW
jgi:hypothetical protein